MIRSDAAATRADMDEYLRRVRGSLADHEGPVHAVLGGPEPDVDTVAATLCLALHLSQRQAPGGVCVPVLCGQRHDMLPVETLRYLQRLGICKGSLLRREDVDLVKLHVTGRLSLTLLREGLLDGSEYPTLESSILRVVHQDAGDDGASSAVTTVTRELLQEAAEHVGAALGETLGEALRLQSEALWSCRGRRPAQLEELMEDLVVWSRAPAAQHQEEHLQDLEQLLAVALTEFSDGGMTVALTSVTTDREAWQDYVEALKSFSEHYDYDGLVVLLSITGKLHHPRQQVAVYSNNTDILNQICCELEESSRWSLSGELDAKENLQVYHIPLNTSWSSGTPPLLVEEIQDLLKVFIDRQSSVLACHRSSRTSSTEGVAGSVEFSQGSSGINDMDGSDIERAEGGNEDTAALTSRVIADGEDDTGGGVGAVGELVSPDSGMTTIRSSRSSKESSVFLSDESPVGEVTAAGGPTSGPLGLFIRNPSPMGLSSLSPPVPPERRKHRCTRNKTDFDLFSFDPLHSNDQSMPTGGESANTNGRGDGEKRAESSSFSEVEELNLLDFSPSNSLGRLESSSSVDHNGQIQRTDLIDTMVPPTPVNSVVGSRPPSSCGVRFFPEDVVERINGLQHKASVSSSLSETWDELGFDTVGAMSSSDSNAWNRTKEEESPQNITEELRGKKSADMMEQASKKEILQSENSHQTSKNLELQVSLITEQTESYDNWKPDSLLKDQWNSATLAYLQLTPPEEEVTGKGRVGITGVKEKKSSLARKKAILNTLTPDTSKEEDEAGQTNKGDRQTELLDFWTYSAQKGFLKSDSGTTTSYPESLDMWNMTIRDDSLSPLTTPDNLSETSGSFWGLNPNAGTDASMESPVGFTDSGMVMWNTTIREDSSSTITSPEGPENGKDLSLLGSLDVSDYPEIHESKQVGEENALEEERGIHKVISQAVDNVGWRGNEHNVKIVIEVVEGKTQDEETGYDDTQSFQGQQSVSQNLASERSEDLASPYCGSGMVISTSEYDNVGAGSWSLMSSPEAYGSPVTDIILLESQSNPFVGVTNPIQKDEKHDQYQTVDSLGTTEPRAGERSASQVFLFEGGHMSGGGSIESKYDNKRGKISEEADWIEQPTGHSPFVLVDFSTVTQDTSTNHRSSPGGDPAIQKHTNQSLCTGLGIWDHDAPESNLSSRDLQITMAINEDEPDPEILRDRTNESIGNIKGKTAKTLISRPCGEQDTLKYSHDSLHPGSQGDLRSNCDRDPSPGLEMEYIFVSGTVKEAERASQKRPLKGDKPSKGTGKSMEAVSVLSCAATVLQTQAKAAQRRGENTEQSQQNEITGSAATEHHMVAERDTRSQSKNNCSQTQVEDANYDDKSITVAINMSPSLRYPSDNFLRTREEVYVHSQISMEESDEGGQSPSAPPPCPTSLEDLQVWRGQLVRKDTPQTPSESQSPEFTHSSVSHASSLTGTPISESGISTDRGLGLPFSGDLMNEENEDEDINEEHTSVPKWTSEAQRETEEGQHLRSSQPLSFTEDLNGASPFQQTHLQRGQFQQNRADYYDEQRTKIVRDRDKWSTERQFGNSQDTYSNLLRHQEVTLQISSQPGNENASIQWTGSHNDTQGQTQCGYNYHHIDQRTENQSANPACADIKPNSRQNTTDVYAEFTTGASAMQYGCAQVESYYQPGVNPEYSLDDPGSEFKYMAEGQNGDDSNPMRTSELQCSQDQAEGQNQFESDLIQYQFEEDQCKSCVQHEREDHVQYVPEDYVHFLRERESQLGEGASGMIMKMVSTEESPEEMDSRADPPSFADLSAGSNQKRKLAAPPMDVSLDHSEGSVLSEDALDTEDDLDVSIDELDTSDEADLQEDSEESNRGAGAASSCAVAAEERDDGRLWRSVVIGEQVHCIDMKCIEPYKRVISHGGYYAERNAIIVFAACFLPDSSCDNYNHVMENLFLYAINTLELMVAEDYMIVYLNGATPRRRMPGFTWMKKCYQMIDRRLKKNLKMFIIVHPSWFIRTLLGITKPFISSKFSSKIKYVSSLQELGEIIPMEYVYIPPSIVKADKKGNSAV